LVATPDVTALQRSDLNNFLFADVGTEANGMTLCVLSVFARLGSDPWREAGRLADLSKPEATDSLAHTIADMPTSLWKFADAAVIAARLTRLLPVRPARSYRGAAGFTGFNIGWHPTAKTAAAVACIALGLGVAISALIQASPARFDGSDVASFSAPAQTDAPERGATVPR
jgi:hypothetical protein